MNIRPRGAAPVARADLCNRVEAELATRGAGARTIGARDAILSRGPAGR
jgi:hypothetical protein